jgi:2-aminoethylphosphonate-pyruvate transaminase
VLLLIPGPVSTRPEVKAAMTRDIAPWDTEFRILHARVRDKVLATAGVGRDTHAALPLQGCGHFGMEAILRSLVPADGLLLVPLTGAYAARLARLAREIGRSVIEMPIPQTVPLDPATLAAALDATPAVSHVALIYSETSTGVVHDVRALGAVAWARGKRTIIDSVSAFAALPLPLADMPEAVAALFTSNKCLEGMPGLSVTVARNDALEHARPAGSWCFDLTDIFRHSRGNGEGSFRFTPPAQVVLALDVALDLHSAEGGGPARLARYTANAETLYDGMAAIGLRPWLPREIQGPIVLNVHAPADPAWSLPKFVEGLKRHGFVISNFYDTPTPTFRVGCIGQITPDDMRGFCAAADEVLDELGVRNRAPSKLAA